DWGEISSPEGMQQYITLNTMAKMMKSSSEAMGKTLDYLERPNSSLNSNITYAAKNYTYYANQIMVGYNSAVASRELLQKVSEISSSAYEARKLSYQLGMVTEADLISAQKDVLSAQSSLLKVESTIDSLRRSLNLMTGYSADSSPAIGTVPVLAEAALSALDLEADTAKAIGNNYTLISERRASSDKTTTGMKNKEASVSAGEQNVAVTMESYYQAVMQAKSAYEAAGTAYERAKLEKGKADRSYQLGMLGKISYLQAEMAFLQAESEWQSAYNTLYQAYDTYQWAVKGIIMTSAQ
ncbi:TolC family protein, partial [Lachnospiraceae bacterium 54-53]